MATWNQRTITSILDHVFDSRPLLPFYESKKKKEPSYKATKVRSSVSEPTQPKWKC
jgi:hypothetical protein